MTPIVFIGGSGDVMHRVRQVVGPGPWPSERRAIYECGAKAKRAFIATDYDWGSFMLRYLRPCEGCWTPEIRNLKRQASLMVRQAVAAGTLTRGPCEVCGTTERIHGHHDDYSKPLSVRWLCSSHHSKWHHKNEALAPQAVAS